ncbi:MAG: excinuclease ABC subunit UvrC [Desulfocapsa sp.]|nr:excinuclease ABC subunit UvrC [Desulfocapsa sp.]
MFPADFLETVPKTPGVYLMLDKQSRVLYVGKAKNLKNRLTSYTRFSGSDHNKTTVMLSKVVSVDTLLTNTEKEALILEASLIKKHKPKYNIILRDDKNYPFIKVTVQDTWPRVHMARRRKKDGARYFGPYASSSSMWSTIRLLANLFPLRKCKGAKIRPRNRPCLNLQLGKCLGPCVDLADPEVYRDQVKKVLMVLEGRNRSLVKELTREMEICAEQLLFEKAAELRDQIGALSKTLEKQIIASSTIKDQDVFGYFREGTSIGIAILFVREGLITGHRNFFLSEAMDSDAAILSQVLNQFYDENMAPAKEVILPFAPNDGPLLRERFSELSGSNVTFTVPQRGDLVQLLNMAITNAGHIFDEKEKKERSWQSLSSSLAKSLHLAYTPTIIECLDISNTSGKQAVGSLVCFRKGEPLKSLYRHYKITTVPGPDDYAMMEEVLRRRLGRALQEKTLPDLFIVDGGRGQLGVAMRVAEDLGIKDDLDWIGIAKGKNDEGEKLYKPGRKNPILLKSHHPVLLYLMRIRDESHRYGITFHRKLRGKDSVTSTLDDIPGVGPGRKKTLLKHFGSVKRIREAGIEELSSVPGIGRDTADTIHKHFILT